MWHYHSWYLSHLNAYHVLIPLGNLTWLGNPLEMKVLIIEGEGGILQQSKPDYRRVGTNSQLYIL